MADPQIIAITLEPAAGDTHFSLRYNLDGGDTWTPYSTASASPSTPEDLAVSLLADGVYLLDGVNAPTGNMAAASLAGNWYSSRFKNSAGYGNWSLPFNLQANPYGAYPVGADLKAFLESAGLTISAALEGQLDGAVAGGIADFERATGRRFVAVTSEKRRDPPVNWQNSGAILRLQDDLVSDDPADISIVYTPAGTTAETLVYGTDYDFGERESECAEKGWPWREVRFYRRWAAPLSAPYRRSLYITGAWGFGSSVPADVWGAVLSRAAWLSAPQFVLGYTGGVRSWERAGRSVSYGDNPLGSHMTAWGGADGNGGAYGRAVGLYRLI